MVMAFMDAFYMLKDAWNIYKKYAAQYMDDEMLEMFTEDIQKVYEKYQSPFAKDIVLALIAEIERGIKVLGEKNESNI